MPNNVSSCESKCEPAEDQRIPEYVTCVWCEGWTLVCLCLLCELCRLVYPSGWHALKVTGHRSQQWHPQPGLGKHEFVSLLDVKSIPATNLWCEETKISSHSHRSHGTMNWFFCYSKYWYMYLLGGSLHFSCKSQFTLPTSSEIWWDMQCTYFSLETQT